MFKRSDILPLVLAFVSTVLVLSLGFFGLTQASIISSDAEDDKNSDGALNVSSTQSDELLSSVSPNSSVDSPQGMFIVPSIVPQGTSVSINGSKKVERVNQILRRGFHQQFPGTVISTDADGNQVGIDLLSSGDVDIAAVDRPLNKAEKSAGLSEVKIKIDNASRRNSNEDIGNLHYVYREPVSSEVEAFLGYVLSPKGQLAISNR